ncbi:hypothetical protein [Streptomyces sp. NPDC047123]|uniref:hypothetical protein n=1 Tax=Streptomyces sp. NPDC047123 TaxID=3155622 RepID=UPI00340D0009
MAHAAPVYSVPAARAGATARWAGPVLLAVVYGLWACAIRRDGGPITTGNVLFGVVAGLVAGAVFAALHRLAPTLPRELRAVTWAAFAGIAFGFLYSLSDASVLRSVGMALALTAAVFVAVFYRAYTTE